MFTYSGQRGMSGMGAFDPFGWFQSNVLDPVAQDFVNTIQAVPGVGAPMVSAMSSVINGPLKDFANTAVGKIVLTALATELGDVTFTLGPQIAVRLGASAFALPGMARGDDFEHAWIDGFASRVQQTAQILGPGVATLVTDQLANAVGALVAQYGAGASNLPDFPTIASQLGIRQDAAAFARAIVAKADLPNPDDFDLGSGLYKPDAMLASSAFAVRPMSPATVAYWIHDGQVATLIAAGGAVRPPAGASLFATAFGVQATNTPALSAPVKPAAAPVSAVKAAAPASTGMSTTAQVAIAGGLAATVAAVAWFALK